MCRWPQRSERSRDLGSSDGVRRQHASRLRDSSWADRCRCAPACLVGTRGILCAAARANDAVTRRALNYRRTHETANLHRPVDETLDSALIAHDAVGDGPEAWPDGGDRRARGISYFLWSRLRATPSRPGIRN